MGNLFRGRTNITIAIAMVVGALLVTLVLGNHVTRSSTIRIGVLHSLTGTMATSEAPLVDAVRLAVEEANLAGGINGARIEMIVADCRSDAAYCAQQAERLITVDRVHALFGCWTSSCRKAVKSVVEKHHHLLFYPLQYEGMEQSTDIVYTGATPNQQLIPMVSWAMQEHGKRAYLIGSDYVFPRTANLIVKKLLLAKGGHLTAERYVPLGEKDMDEIVRNIASLRPDFVVNTLNGDSNLHFFQALQKAGIYADDIPVFSTSIAESELVAIGPDRVAGHYAAWSYFMSLGRDANRAFIERFRKRYGRERVLSDPMEAAYIAVQLWVNALRNAGSLELHTVKSVIAQQTLAAPEGIVAVDEATMHLWKPIHIGRARADGQFDIVWGSKRSIAPAPFPFLLSNEQRSVMLEGKQ